MLTIQGEVNSAISHARDLDKGAVGQLKAICNLPFVEGAKIRIMPDAHMGKGCVIGTTMTIEDAIVPNFVGVDISCGMEVVNIGHVEPDFKQLDMVIRSRIPAGPHIRKEPHEKSAEWSIEDLVCKKKLQQDRALKSLGTLGGGNHFIELSRNSETCDFYLVIHSGSRNLGLQIANYYQEVAGKRDKSGIPFMLCPVRGSDFEDYVHDMKVMQKYADLNRRIMAEEILTGMGWDSKDRFTTVHNYLDTDHMILRKGAVSAQKGERLLIPMNMRDGSLLCEGLGNPEWNFSAPHGAGRLTSRKTAKETLSMVQYQKDMEGIYTTCVSPGTLDESPAAYKPMEEILSCIGETVKINAFLKPVYNFKVS